MRSYRITVNGNVYDVQVEELNGAAAQTPAAAVPVSPSPIAAAPAASAASPAPAAGAAGSAKVTAPMPGSILDIKVNVGDKVAENQVIVILEAMKMENEITSTASGTVASINVNKGQSVNSGDVLITIAE